MTIPRKGSKIICLDDVQYRWIAFATDKGTEVRIETGQNPGSQMLVAQVPKLFNLKWLETMIDYGLENGWNAGYEGDPIYIRKAKDTYRILESHEIPTK